MRPLDFLDGGGRTGALMRAHDWSRSPLGDPSTWPQSLRTVVGLLLQSQFPMFVAWGGELGFIYNDSYAEILGAKHPDALGRRFHDIWAEIWPDISPLIDAAMAGEATFRHDLPLLMKRKGYDEQTWFTFSYSPVRDDDGRIAGMFCACTETTEKVVAERSLRELNETLEHRVDQALAERKLLADIVEGTDAMVQVADLDYRWLAINPAAAGEFERLFHVRPRVGDSMLDVLAGQSEHQAAVKAPWSRALAGEAFTGLWEYGDSPEAYRAYDMRFNVLRNADGARIGAYQFVYDVTARLRDQERLRNAEAALRQAQKMESLGQLTGGVAHDFNNLLAVFASGLQLLERSGKPSPRVLEAMQRAVVRGTGLTRHLLAFSRRAPVNPESIDIAAHLHGMRPLLDGSLGGNIHIDMRLAANLWPIEADAGEMELAILNLCVNARDAMANGGVITITAENIPSSGDDPEGMVKLTVADTGAGMPPEVAARVFEPFFATKDVSKGSGLGLPQVYGFANQSGGHVSIDSVVGQGTVVTLVLPRCASLPAAASQTAAPGGAAVTPRQSGERGHLLLVEDDDEVSALTGELLSGLGFAVTLVTSADAALAALDGSNHFDVVLSDVMMPGGTSGLQMARQIRRQRPQLPILLTTGYVEAVAEMKDGEFPVLSKPFTLDALAAALGVDVR